MRLITDMFFLFLFFVLLVGWLLAWAAFHVAGGAIHLLLIIAVIIKSFLLDLLLLFQPQQQIDQQRLIQMHSLVGDMS